jgi:hypothetical protein
MRSTWFATVEKYEGVARHGWTQECAQKTRAMATVRAQGGQSREHTRVLRFGIFLH